MDGATALATIAIVWVVTGFICAFFMARRGHSPFTWWLLGTVFGPLVLALMLDAVFQEKDAKSAVTHRLVPPDVSHGEGLHVIVGIDGSPQARAALLDATVLLRGRIGTLTLASVADFETGEGPSLSEDPDDLLRDAATLCEGIVPEQVVLYGRPAEKLVELATSESADVLVVGLRGKGLNRALMGSVATKLSHSSPIPVLVAGQSHPAKAAIENAGATADLAAPEGRLSARRVPGATPANAG